MNTTRTTVRGSKTRKKPPTTTSGNTSSGSVARINYGPGGIFAALTKADLAENPVLLDMLRERDRADAKGKP